MLKPVLESAIDSSKDIIQHNRVNKYTSLVINDWLKCTIEFLEYQEKVSSLEKDLGLGST